jgi:predicted CXXCH cytochrome family protein
VISRNCDGPRSHLGVIQVLFHLRVGPVKYPLMGSVSNDLRRNATVGEDLSPSSTWVISPVPLWEKAQQIPIYKSSSFSLPGEEVCNTTIFSDLPEGEESGNNSSLCGTPRAWFTAEAVVKQTWKLALGFLLALAAANLPLAAAEHPLKLEKDADCASCHEDKTKGKAVHSAIAMGCATCHDVKTEGDTTTVTLTSPKDQLCFTCHEKAKEEVKHGPYEKGSCVTCHDPHTSDFPKQLRAELNANFCLECHGPRKDVPEKVALFKSQAVTRDEFLEIPKIFLSADQSSGHPIDRHPTAGVRNPMKPEEKLTCTSCHAIHASSEAKLLPHPDKEGRDVCAQCHVIVDSAHEDKAIAEGKTVDAQRIQELKKKNPDAGKPAKKHRGGEEQQ